MKGRNFLGNHSAVVVAHDNPSGTDSAFVTLPSYADLQASGSARCVTCLLEMGTVSNAAAVVDLRLETRPGTTGDWRTIGTTSTTPKANQFVAIEADSNGASLDRYVRVSYQRKTHASEVHGAIYILGDLRSQGIISVGQIADGAIVTEKSSLGT